MMRFPCHYYSVMVALCKHGF